MFKKSYDALCLEFKYKYGPLAKSSILTVFEDDLAKLHEAAENQQRFIEISYCRFSCEWYRAFAKAKGLKVEKKTVLKHYDGYDLSMKETFYCLTF